MEINGVPVVQNKHMGQTLALIDMEMEKQGDSWSLARIDLQSLALADYQPDPDLTVKLEAYHEEALKDAGQVIGRLKEGPLVPESPKEIRTDLPTAQVEDTPLIDLINQVQLYYSGAKVSATCLCDPDSNLIPGDIHKYDMSRIYKYDNTLYKMRMNGSQLKKFMEWSARYLDDPNGKDPIVKAREGIPDYLYMIFEGVSYQVNLNRPVGSRIENLTWPDGSLISDEEEFEIAINNYVASSVLMLPGEIYEENDLPVLLEMDVKGSIGGIRELIRDYIVNVKKGTIHPECDHNWKIVVSD